MSTEDYQRFVGLMKKLRKLESYKEYFTVNGGICTDFYNPNHNYPCLPRLPKMKNIEFMYSVGKEWYFLFQKNCFDFFLEVSKRK